MAAPKVSTVSSLAVGQVRVTFDQALLNNSALVAAANYTLTPPIGAATLVISAVLPEGVANPTYVDLNVSEMTDAASYTCAVGDAGGAIENLTSEVLNPLDPANTKTFTGNGTLPTVSSAEVIGGDTIRVSFSEPMRKDALLSLPANYLFTPVTAGAAQLFFDSVSVPDLDDPTYVDIEVSEMTNGATYDVTVNGPTDKAFNPIGAPATASFTGEGANPYIESVIPVSKNRVDVVFSEAMLDNADINDPTKYTWNYGLTTLAVLEVTTAGVVKLSTSDQHPGTLYTLTVTP